MSSAVSDTHSPVPALPAGPAGRRSRPHIIAFDMIRLVIMVFVVSVHTLSFAGGAVTMSIGAVTTIFHTSRELFIMLTALVLTYNYGKRDLKLGKFWWRRFYLVVPAYVVWSAIYYAADGHTRGAFPGAFINDLLNAGARYHLYFLLVSMQVYLLFPVIRWVLIKTERYHAWLLGLAVAYQVWLTCALHYHIWRGGPALAGFLGGAESGIYVTTYLLYVVVGALAGWHFEAVSAFTRRVLTSYRRAALVAASGVAAGIGVFLIETEIYNATPGNASAVFQPIVIVEGLAFGWALLGAGLLWSDRGARARTFCAAGSASSFGIYLAHPLVLQVLLLIAGASVFGGSDGLVGWIHRLSHSSLEVLILLFIAVPIIYAGAWLIASAMRRTWFSLPLTGREYKRDDKKPTVTGRAIHAVGDTALAHAAAHGYTVTTTGVTTGLRSVRPRYWVIAAVVVVVAVAGTVTGQKIDYNITRQIDSTTSSMQVGGLTRSYTVFTPAKKALPSTAPIIVMLSGLNSTQDQEVTRDEFMPYVSNGNAEVVYPLAYRESWNAVGCCSWAADANVDDTGFITQLARAVDPGDTRPIYLVGYSNGARLAYTIACQDPLLFTGIAAVKGDPLPWCNVGVPQKVLQVAAADDTDTPYYTGEKGNFRESPAALVQDTDLKTADGCNENSSKQSKEGDLTLTMWPECSGGSSVTFAVYSQGVHSFPRPPGSYPTGSQVVWAWIHDTVSISALPHVNTSGS